MVTNRKKKNYDEKISSETGDLCLEKRIWSMVIECVNFKFG